MTGISSTGIFKNKMRILYCSSSPNRKSVPRALFCTTAGSWICATNITLGFVHWLVKATVFLIGGSVYQAQSNHLLDPLRNHSLSLGPAQPLPWPSDWKWGTGWFSGHYLPKALGTAVTLIMGDFERGDTKIFLRTIYRVILVLKTESIDTTLFISPGQKC